jgi:hypothetical protein
MSNGCPQVLMLTIVVATSTLTARRAACAPVSAVHFELDEHGGIIVPITIGGVGPFRFILDTGASGTSISEALVARVDAPIVAKADVTTPAGHSMTFVAALRDVRLGVISSEKILAVTVPADALAAAAGVGIVGILGQDFLGPHNYTLDYRHRMLTWDDEDARQTPGAETTLKLVPRNGQLLVELPQPDASTVQMVPDSGADALIVFARPEARLPISEARGATQLTGMTGARDATAAIVRQLAVGSITLRNQTAVAVRLDADDPHAGDGLLPLHHFASVSFHASGYIVFRR